MNTNKKLILFIITILYIICINLYVFSLIRENKKEEEIKNKEEIAYWIIKGAEVTFDILNGNIDCQNKNDDFKVCLYHAVNLIILEKDIKIISIKELDEKTYEYNQYMNLSKNIYIE